MEEQQKHTGANYEALASKYADLQDAKPWNVYCERPAVVRFLPALAGRAVLDAGPGSTRITWSSRARSSLRVI